MDDVFLIAIVTLLAVVAILAIALVVERRRISRMFVKATAGGIEFSVELHQLVQREVNKATIETLRRVAALDEKQIEYWERESTHKHEDSGPKLKLLEENVSHLELAFSTATTEEKPHIGFALREMYWAYLRHARYHFASSARYQQIQRQVLAGLQKLKAL